MIIIGENDLVDLLAGRRPEIEVGTLPMEVRRYFGCSRDTIFLSAESARHIVNQHGEHVTVENIKQLPLFLRNGLWISDRRNHCVVSYNQSEGFRFKAVVKVTKDRVRTYVQTLHRTASRQTKSILKRGTILRPHW